MSLDARPWAGGVVTPRARCVLAPNPGPMTLDGTNTWILAEPGSDEAIVLDPGPLHPQHLDAVRAEVAASGARVSLVLLTHGHADHAEGAAAFAESVGAPVRALGAGHANLGEGEGISVGGLELVVVATPGHTADCLSFLLPADGALLTGDTILGRGTTVVAWPDGHLADYLASLRRIRSLTGAGAVRRVLPGHGPDLADAAAIVDYYLRHRAQRLNQVRAALAAGASTVDDVLGAVYADVPRQVWPAARLSIQAQLDYLTDDPG